MPVNIAPSPNFTANQLPQLPPLELAGEQHAAQMPDYAGVAAVEAAQPGTRAALDPETTADLAESMARLNATANGEDVSPNDTRMYDINAAHDAAIQENQNRDLGLDVEAAREMALQENKARDEAAAAAKAAAQEIKTKEQADKTTAEAEAQAATASDVNAEAAKALEQAKAGTLAPQSHVEKNPLTNELVITTGNNIKVLEPQGLGGYKVTSYDVNPFNHKVTKSEGGIPTVLTASGLEAADQNTPEGEIVMLPPAVARAAGFRAAVKQGSAQPRAAEAATV